MPSRCATPTSPQPGPGELLVAPLRVGLCATDLELIDGSLIYLRTGQLRLPIVPGHEWVGRVVEVGPGRSGDAGEGEESDATYRPGDIVVGECSIGCGRCTYCAIGGYHQCPDRRETGIIGLDGALQQLMIFPARSAHQVPDGVDLADAALVEPTAVAFRAVRRLDPPPRASVLVVGGGTQGFLAAMILAGQRDSDVAVLDNRPDRMERLRLFGVRAPAADETFGYVLEAAGAPGSLDAARVRMAPGGRLVVVGLSGRPVVDVAVDDLVVKDQTMIGSIGSPGVWPEVLALIASGGVRPSALVTHVLDIADVVAAQGLLRRRDPAVGKVLIAPNDA